LPKIAGIYSPTPVVLVAAFVIVIVVICKLLRQDIKKVQELISSRLAAIQLLSNIEGGEKCSTKGDTIQYIYTNIQHNNPLCRMVPLENLQKGAK